MNKLVNMEKNKILSNNAVDIKDITFSYPDKENVLNSISLQIKEGERVGIIGPNGAGKTTLFLLLTGILKPVSGELLLFEKKVNPDEFRREIGYVFQNPDDQLFLLSVKDDIAFGLKNIGLKKNDVENITMKTLLEVGIPHLSERIPHHLSLGEKRMVSIATVIAMNPKLIIYDEPTSNLDIKSRRRLIKFMQDHSTMFIVASHDLEFILEVCDRIILLDNGKIIEDGNPKKILKNKKTMEDHGLEIPHSLIPHSHYL